MTDILDHLQPDSPLYEATRDAAREEIIRLRLQLKDMAEALELFFAWEYSPPGPKAGMAYEKLEMAARAALTKYRGKE